MKPAAFALLLALTPLCFVRAQVTAVKVYSEFQRPDPFGGVVAADQPAAEGVIPREILSPGLVRNASATYHVAVTAAPGTEFTMHIQQNPKDYLGVTLYQEIWEKRDDQWIADRLEPVETSFSTAIPEASGPIPRQNTLLFLIDLHVASDAEVRRTRLEVQVYSDGNWIIYPMEIRILKATIPVAELIPVPKSAPGAPSDTTARAALKAYLCGSPKGAYPEPRTVQSMILRNASQDVALARALETAPGQRSLPLIKQLAGGLEEAAWCAVPVFPTALGPEWYLRFRDALYRMVD
jgi:hypothetical protein